MELCWAQWFHCTGLDKDFPFDPGAQLFSPPSLAVYFPMNQGVNRETQCNLQNIMPKPFRDGELQQAVKMPPLTDPQALKWSWLCMSQWNTTTNPHWDERAQYPAHRSRWSFYHWMPQRTGMRMMIKGIAPCFRLCGKCSRQPPPLAPESLEPDLQRSWAPHVKNSSQDWALKDGIQSWE